MSKATPKSDSPSTQEVWETLSKISVKGHIDKKGGLSYLSWAWAWQVLKENYPQAQYKFREWATGDTPIDQGGQSVDCMVYADGTAAVHCEVSIGDVAVSMWLPVMDYRNKSIKNPDSRSISDSKMRCLVKAIAMLGLGLYIYEGLEELPDSEDKSEPEQEQKEKEEEDKDVSKDPEEESVALPDNKQALLVIQVFMEDLLSVADLQDYYRSNAKQIKEWANSDPELHREVMDLFKSKKAELKKKESK